MSSRIYVKLVGAPAPRLTTCISRSAISRIGLMKDREVLICLNYRLKS